MSSQLDLIIVTIGIKQSYQAFLHICTNTFFKGILFPYSALLSIASTTNKVFETQVVYLKYYLSPPLHSPLDA